MSVAGHHLISSRWLRVAAATSILSTGAAIAVMDWWPSPLNRNIDLTSPAERLPSTVVHGSVAVLAAVVMLRGPRWARVLTPLWFGTVLGSAVMNWWVPYVVDRYPGEISPALFSEQYAANLSVLPVLAGHPVVPDLQHLMIHSLVAASATLSAAVVVTDRRLPHP